MTEAEILDGEEVLEDPQVVHNGILAVWDHPSGGKVRQPKLAARFSATPVSFNPSGALLGEHNDEILAELGHDPKVIGRLRADGVIL